MEDQSERSKGNNSKKKPFKLTRQLIRLALNDGWTQREIAEKCRVYQSVVSTWSKGAKCATEAQLMPLLEIYGHKLRRNTFRVYWALDSNTQAKTFFRIEGKVVFAEVVFELKESSGKATQKVPMMKLIIHHQGADSFRSVVQSRLELDPPIKLTLSSADDAVWSSEVSDQQSSAELIDWLDGYANSLSEQHPHIGLTLPFLLRQALINHGFPVDGVVDYPAVW
ncbi:hypothetical protein [Stutzerimonas kunmingensis]|uniref:hypothetical protein n=1 Tax=Stutzerimonas kunmingensis TaxID=1211807 RepID=UPI00241D9F2C|nr:hypothetical protein [Stutzerimonas kunmingensis]